MTDSITCPQCQRTSHHPADISNRYCGNCHEYHDAMDLLSPYRNQPVLTIANGVPKISRRTYLTLKVMESGSGMFIAAEAVASTAIEHPEWDMDETKTWVEWDES